HESTWKGLKSATPAEELHGKTMLIVGLGGVGTQIAKRANAFGMKVMALDPNAAIERPSFVFSLDHPKELKRLISKPDVIVLACPLTDETRGMFGAKQFYFMKPSAYFINIGRGGLVKTRELVT